MFVPKFFKLVFITCVTDLITAFQIISSDSIKNHIWELKHFCTVKQFCLRGMELHAVCDILLSRSNIVQWKGDVSNLFRKVTGAQLPN